MTPTPPTQLQLPLDILQIPPPIQPLSEPSVRPEDVWKSVDQTDRGRIRAIWVRVMRETPDEQR